MTNFKIYAALAAALFCITPFAQANEPCEILAQDIQELNREPQYMFTFAELLVLVVSEKGLEKKMESYGTDVAHLYELHAIEPAPTQQELQALWLSVMRKVVRRYLFLMSFNPAGPGAFVRAIPAMINGPQMMTLEAWENFKAIVAEQAQQYCEPAATEAAEQIQTVVSI